MLKILFQNYKGALFSDHGPDMFDGTQGFILFFSFYCFPRDAQPISMLDA